MPTNVEVTNFQLTVDEQPIDTVSNLMYIKTRVEYKGGTLGIFPGDKISISINNTVNEIFNIIGFGNTTINIYGDGDIGKVGTRTYRNDSDGNYYLEVEFDDGYSNYFGGMMPDNITGWLETSVYVIYKKWVQEPTTTVLTAIINGISISKNINVKVGGGPAPERLDTPGSIIGKTGRYGAYSGNMGDFPEVEFNDYPNFDPIRWGLQVGYQNLTWRDLRSTNGDSYYTTNTSLMYSNNNSTDERYQSNNESYLLPYAVQQGYPINAPFHYENCQLEDYLVIGSFGGIISSAHEYVKDSLRIIRVMGREQNNTWWGKDAFRVLADNNFLKYDPSEPIDRYLTDLFFKDYRGLTIDEFLAQMHSEGQLLDKTTVDDILTFDYVNNGEAPGVSDPADTNKIPHFKLLLGDLHFDGNTARTIDLIGFDNTVVFGDIPTKNLPYGYLVYYDTKATEAILNHEGFHYNNSAIFKFEGDTRSITSIDIWIKLEDGSGGSGQTTEVRIKKVDEKGEPLAGVKFTLSQINTLPPHLRQVFTTINGTASFTMRAGEYILTEEAPEKFSPLAPMHFVINNMEELFNLKKALEGTGYADWDKLKFLNNINIITNQPADPPDPPDPPKPKPDFCKSVWDVVTSIALQEVALANILSAEADKLQTIVNHEDSTFDELIKANRSVSQLVKTIIRLEMMLQEKLKKLPIDKCVNKRKCPQ